MKVKIRKGLFETNSSSTHALCIKKETELYIPKNARLVRQKFGWEFEEYSDFEYKANYIFELCIANDGLEDELNWGENIVKREDVSFLTYEEAKEFFKEDSYCRKYIDFLHSKGIEVEVFLGKAYDGGIDHWEGINIGKVLDDTPSLENFLFSGLSYITTGNDNDEYLYLNCPINTKDYEIIYKGN